MIAVVEEDFLNVGGIRRDITITRLGIIRVFGFLPLDRWTRRRTWRRVELRMLHPTLGHRVVAQLLDDGVVALMRVFGIGRCTLHRRNTRRCAQLAVILLALFLYLQHAGGIVFLPCRNVVATDAIAIAELAYAEFTCYTFIADEVMLGRAVLRHSDNRSRIDGVVLGFPILTF